MSRIHAAAIGRVRATRVRVTRIAWFEAIGLGRAIALPSVLGLAVLALLLVLQKPRFLTSDQFVVPSLDAIVLGVACAVPLTWLVFGVRERGRKIALVDPARTAAGWSLGILVVGSLLVGALLLVSYTSERILVARPESRFGLFETAWRSIFVLVPFAALAPAFLFFASGIPLVAASWMMVCALCLGLSGPAGAPIPADIFVGEFEWTDVTVIALCTLAGHFLSAAVLHGRNIPPSAAERVEIE